MAMNPRILAFAGSAREESFNKRLVRIAANGAKAAGGDVTLLDLRDYPLAIYDADYEAQEGVPANARKLKKIFAAYDGLLIASPEYNSSMSGLLKNTIDWISRPVDDEKSLAAFTGKVVAIMSASPGGLGGLRGLVHLRAILGNLQMLVLPDQIAISEAHNAFNSDGSLKDAKRQAAVEKIGATLANTIAKLKA